MNLGSTNPRKVPLNDSANPGRDYLRGYLPAADYWRLGAIFGLIFFAAFLAIGVPWMLAIR